ncbi:MAG: DUF1413 domain-containing protein [Rhodobacteraceae bacterium]|nr:DUF1413 domain-containing protein [Paracoccaceae bacterium]MBR9823147.1 DUF1413 domain-containing protein [Paracoccaceae bacterium]
MITREFSRLRRVLAQRPPGPFHFSELIEGWTSLPIGEKVRRGHDFLTAVRDGRMPGVTDTGHKDAAGRRYHWDGSQS